MFVRKKKNKSGSISVQIISKNFGKYKVVKTIGSSKDPKTIDNLYRKGHYMIPDLIGQTSIDCLSDYDSSVRNYFKSTNSLRIRVVGPELLFGKVFDEIGYNYIKDEIFRHLVITRLVYPGSKLKTIDYLRRYQGRELTKDEIYRFLDKLNRKYKVEVEHISFKHTKKILGGKINVVFYDMTTIYFESEDEDDLRKTGFSKDGKHRNPQIFLGLLVGSNGYPIGYEIFEGNIHEGKTLLPVLKAFERKFNLNKPIIIADAALLSKENIKCLNDEDYQYILGGRVKNESNTIKSRILERKPSINTPIEIKKNGQIRLVVSYSDKRAKKDRYNRERGLKRLEKNLGSGKLTKSHVNNRGYNKYLKLKGEIKVVIDYERFKLDECWDGLKGYVTNTKLTASEVIENYKNLWQIEKAFRISKTDLRIRPIYHRLRERIEAHICISFCAYSVYKEVERILYKNNVQMSPKRAIDLSQTIYALDYELPDSGIIETKDVNLSEEQNILIKLFY